MLDLTDMKTDALLLIFITALFHLILICILKLGKVGWKAVDYIWLTFTIIGAIGTVAESAKAKNKMIIEERTKESAILLQSIKSDAEFGSQLPQSTQLAKLVNLDFYGDVSRKDIVVYSQWCDSLKAQVADISSGKTQTLNYFKGKYPLGPPNVSNSALSRHISKTFLDFATYNSDIIEIDRIQREIKSEEVKNLSNKLWSPLLLILALALRFAKVTGEILIERRLTKKG